MHQHGELLFEAESDKIHECLSEITEEDIESCCDYKIFNRGHNYYHEGMVEDITYNKKANNICAEVHGRRKYSVEIYIENEEVIGSCNCEYYDVCKHIVAVLLHIADKGFDSISESQTLEVPSFDSLSFLKTHLESLSKKELINLAMRYVPDDYIRQIENSKSTQKDANAIFDKVEKKINELLRDEDLLWDPTGMDIAIMKQLNKLKGLENQIHDNIGKLLLKIMDDINEALCEGYLYIDNHYEEDYYESVNFNNYVIAFVQQLPFNNRFNFIQELNACISMMDYSTYEEIPLMYTDCFTPEESAKLADYVLDNGIDTDLSLMAKIYNLIDDSLKDKDNEKLLKTLALSGSEEHLILLVEFLVKQERQAEALEYMGKYLNVEQGFIENKIIELFLQLTNETGADMKKAGLTALAHNPREKNLSLIKSFGISDTAAFEDILREDNPVELLSFFEKEKRFAEALTLISNKNRFYGDIVFQFFKRNKKLLKQPAEEYFLKRIDENLLYTGNSYYANIAETVSQLKQINTKLAREVIANIRTNYKRRTNLMGMLERFQ